MPKLKILLQSNIFYIAILLIVILYAFISSLKVPNSSLNINDDTFVGIIKNIEFDRNKIDLIIKVNNKENLKVNYYFNNLDDLNRIKAEIKLGQKIKIKGSLSKPTNNTIPNTFNYKKYLQNQNIYYILKADSYEIIKPESNLYKIKNYLINRIDKFPKTSSYLNAFILGNNKIIDEETMKNYRLNGVSHLFAISGMHIGILTLIISKFLTQLKIKDKAKLIITSLFLLFFGFVTGFASSFLRASLFFILLNLYKLLKINYKTINILFLTASMLLIIKPQLLFDIGFAYSVMTSLGIIISAKYLNNKNKVKALLMVSTVAFLFSLPITLLNFYEINLFSILNNLLFVPLISSILFPLSLITFLVPVCNPILIFVISVVEKLNTFCATYITYVINIPINLIGIVILYFLLLIALSKNLKYLFLVLLTLMIFKTIPYFSNNTYIYYFDVGQGDSSLLIFPHQKRVVLIDTGGKITYDNNNLQNNNQYFVSNNIITFLKSKGINKIDYLILTHGDYDHMGDAINLVNNFKVDKVIFNSDNYNELETELISVLDKKKIKYYKGLKELNVGNDTLYFLNTKEYDNENDNSNVLYFKLNDYQFLFMGDAGVNREKDILDKYNLEDIDFIKIGHHGSNTSSSKEFIDKIKPKNCLISVGKNNRYGHPKEEVLGNLDNYCYIYRTDLSGSVEIKINKSKYRIKTYNP